MSDNLALKEGCFFIKKKKVRERERGRSKAARAHSSPANNQRIVQL